MSDALEDLTARLQEAAARLRAGELSPEEAANLVEACAKLAGEAGAELDRRARAAGVGEPAPLPLPQPPAGP